MASYSRRHFLAAGAAGLVASSFTAQRSLAQAPSPRAAFDRPISFQSYGMRKQVEEDFQGMMRSVKALGYEGMEMCSPRSYERAGYGKLTPLPPAEIKRQIEDAGLICRSSHFSWREVLEQDPMETADYAAAMGLRDIVMSSSGISDQGTADDIKRWGEKVNKAGEIIKKTGLRLGYHNHQISPMIDGKPQYEHLMEATDPEMITMQFQLASIGGGFDIVYYLDKYAGRFSSLHIHDYDPKLRGNRPGRLGGVVPCGEGMIEWPELLRAAMKSDIADHGFIVEIETEEPLEGLRRSINFLKTVQV